MHEAEHWKILYMKKEGIIINMNEFKFSISKPQEKSEFFTIFDEPEFLEELIYQEFPPEYISKSEKNIKVCKLLTKFFMYALFGGPIFLLFIWLGAHQLHLNSYITKVLGWAVIIDILYVILYLKFKFVQNITVKLLNLLIFPFNKTQKNLVIKLNEMLCEYGDFEYMEMLNPKHKNNSYYKENVSDVWSCEDKITKVFSNDEYFYFLNNYKILRVALSDFKKIAPEKYEGIGCKNIRVVNPDHSTRIYADIENKVINFYKVEIIKDDKSHYICVPEFEMKRFCDITKLVMPEKIYEK